MSLARQLRRQQKRGGADIANPLGQLQAVLGDLKKVSDLGDTARGVEALGSKLKEAQALVDELAGLRNDLKQALNREEERDVELNRQRAVFLRFLFHSSDLLMSSSGQDNIERYLAVEQRYRAEYDGMRLLVRFLTWVKEAP